MTRFETNIGVENKTSSLMYAVTLLRLLDRGKGQIKTWTMLDSGKITKELLPVTYSDLAVEGVEDWWLLLWFTDYGLNTCCYSYSNNEYNAFDFSGFPKLLERYNEAVPFKVWQEKFDAVAQDFGNKVFQSSRTDGLVQHNLKRQDESVVTMFIVNDDKTITITGMSGETKTSWRSKSTS